jgi:hypothetical protein
VIPSFAGEGEVSVAVSVSESCQLSVVSCQSEESDWVIPSFAGEGEGEGEVSVSESCQWLVGSWQSKKTHNGWCRAGVLSPGFIGGGAAACAIISMTGRRDKIDVRPVTDPFRPKCPVGYGVIRAGVRIDSRRFRKRSIASSSSTHFDEKYFWDSLHPIIPYPMGRFFGGTLSPGTSCQATIATSLRDNKSPKILLSLEEVVSCQSEGI